MRILVAAVLRSGTIVLQDPPGCSLQIGELAAAHAPEESAEPVEAECQRAAERANKRLCQRMRRSPPPARRSALQRWDFQIDCVTVLGRARLESAA